MENNLIKELSISDAWLNFFKQEKVKDYFLSLIDFLSIELKSGKTIYPKIENWFHAYNLIEPDEIKVLIVGQDPYHGVDKFNNIQGHGLAFSVQDNVVLPPSLKNIFKEMNANPPVSGNLEYLAKQGVFLLNTSLTVEAGKPTSHSKKGWEAFTSNTLKYISDLNEHFVCLGWGKHAHKILDNTIDGNKHYIHRTSHPSPLGFTKKGNNFESFKGSECFLRANKKLKEWGKKEIDWIPKSAQ